VYMNNQSIYHKSAVAIYLDNGDGSLTQTDYRGNIKSHPKTIAFVKNDEQGKEHIKSMKIKMNRTSFEYLYRCPNDNKPYSSNKWSRRGNVNRTRGMVISVRS